jgi:hypothetical protein
MMHDPGEMEARADRARRRGDLKAALVLYEALAQRAPEEARLREKLASVRATLQPAELDLDSPAAGERDPIDLRPATPEQEGERLFVIGDYAGAAAAYRRALEVRPDSELVQERLQELYRLARAAPAHSPTDAALPPEREALLHALLDRISSRRRVRMRAP